MPLRLGNGLPLRRCDELPSLQEKHMIRRKSAAASGLCRLLSRALAAVGAVAVLAGASTTVRAQEPPPGDPAAVVDALRKGGYVIFMRHALTEQEGGMDETPDLPCHAQRQLSAAGRAQAVEIGKAIKALRVPVGVVQASPFCRTRETAQLAFGRAEVNNDLLFVITSAAGEAKRLGQALRKLLATPPKPGTNSVLVSHSANLREAAGVFAKPEGATYIYRPLPNGSFEAVAKLLAEDWSRLAERRRPATKAR
jgi:broad specificity phosphatase PhoE